MKQSSLLVPLSSSSSSFQLTNNIYQIIRWLMIIGIYCIIVVDILILSTEPFHVTTSSRMESIQQQQQQRQQQQQPTTSKLLRQLFPSLSSSAISSSSQQIRTGPFTSLLISFGLMNQGNNRRNNNMNNPNGKNHPVTDPSDQNKPPRPPPLQSTQSKQYVINQLIEAGISYDVIQKYEPELPNWEQIIQLYGNEPIILGLETCTTFQQQIRPQNRMIGPAGMFSTGTNLLTQLLKQNCFIPERLALFGNNNKNVTKEQLGMRWQVRKCFYLL
jgi:hypothetical protein